MRILLIIFLILFLSFPVLAGEAGRFGLGINYCAVSNFRMWDSAVSESGSMLRIDYTYDFNDFYTAALEIAFFADENVYKTTAVTTYAQTVAILNIDHIFHMRRVGPFSPYLKFGTGIYGANLWRKTNNRFYNSATDVLADVSAGAGAEFKFWNALLNVDLSVPGLIHEILMARKIPVVLSFGWKQYL
jgi:hypothetical protein